MRVTAVVPLDKRRSKVLLDQDFAFVLYTGERRRYRIEEGAELSEETWREIRDQVLAGRAKERALYLLERCGRTEREIAQKLQEGMYPPEVIRDTLEGLKRLGLLDDEQYGSGRFCRRRDTTGKPGRGRKRGSWRRRWRGRDFPGKRCTECWAEMEKTAISEANCIRMQGQDLIYLT